MSDFAKQQAGRFQDWKQRENQKLQSLQQRFRLWKKQQGTRIANGAQNLYNKAKTNWNNRVESTRKWYGDAKNKLNNKWTNFKTGAKNNIQKTWNGIKSFPGNAKNFATNSWNKSLLNKNYQQAKKSYGSTFGNNLFSKGVAGVDAGLRTYTQTLNKGAKAVGKGISTTVNKAKNFFGGLFGKKGRK